MSWKLPWRRGTAAPESANPAGSFRLSTVRQTFCKATPASDALARQILELARQQLAQCTTAQSVVVDATGEHLDVTPIELALSLMTLGSEYGLTYAGNLDGRFEFDRC